LSTPARENILILCRAIPEESKKYFRTVCVAGINDRDEFRRLYPVVFKPFRNKAGIPFGKKDWIETVLLPPDDKRDKRPESRKLDDSSVKVLREADDNEVRKVVQQNLSPSVKTIQDSGASLGFIKPKITGFDCLIESTDEWDRAQFDLEGKPVGKIKLGQESRYEFLCEQRRGCCENRPHKMAIHDWEANELYRHIIQKDKKESVIVYKMKQKWFDWMTSQRDMYFMMGTHHRYKTWMIVSVLYLRRP
jgi:hypothetical protein